MRPRVLSVVAPRRAGQTHRLYTARGEEVVLLNSSVCKGALPAGVTHVVYHELNKKNGRLFVRDVAPVSARALVLLGGADVAVEHERCAVTVDKWVRLSSPAYVAVLLRELGRQLSTVLSRRFADPAASSTADSETVAAIVALLDGSI
eukprot:m51a1_g1053 putative helicase domain-containing protein (148) ;mRNA; r:785175-785868